MAVSKRLRYEVLRRDGHACRYCGASAPDVKLTVDHVVPVALGGGDESANLVTACASCNSGKSSMAADAPIVEAVSDDALRWAAAMKEAAAIRRAQFEEAAGYVRSFYEQWTTYWYEQDGDSHYFPVPDDFEVTLMRFHDLALEEDTMRRFVRTAMVKDGVWPEDRFRYFCGVCWREIKERQDVAHSLIVAEDEA